MIENVVKLRASQSLSLFYEKIFNSTLLSKRKLKNVIAIECSMYVVNKKLSFTK